MASTSKKILLVDGHAMAFRAYYAMGGQQLTNSAGMPTGAIVSFYRMLAKLLKDFSPEYFLLIFDPRGENFRNRLYPEYKANRKEAPEEFKLQIAEIQEIAYTINLPVLIPSDVEADDAIASFVQEYKDKSLEIYIVSGDKDLYPLLSEGVKMLRPKKGVTVFNEITPESILEDLEVSVSEFQDYLAIVGDSSDNIPGVKGIGAKGAAKLIGEHHSLESIYQNIENISPASIQKKLIDSKENALLSKELILLKYDVPLPFELDSLNLKTFLEDKKNFEHFKEKELNVLYQEFNSLRTLITGDSTQNSDGTEASSPNGINQNYSIVRSLEDWRQVLPTLKQLSHLAVDTETTHTSPMLAKLLGISLSWKEETAKEKKGSEEEGGDYRSVYIPCVMKDISEGTGELFQEDNICEDYQVLPKGKEVIGWVSEILEDSKIVKIGQNIKYDWLVLKKVGVRLQNITFDTMLLSYLIKPNQRRHNLDDMAMDHLAHQTISFKDLAGTGKKQVPLLAVSLDKLAEYACEDSEVTLRLKEILLPMVQKEKLYELYQRIDLPLVYVLMTMEENGILLDVDHLSGIEKKYKTRLLEAEEKIHELAGENFNIQSTQELRRVLFEKLKVRSDKKTEKGQLSTDHRVLERLVDEHPIIKHLLEFRLISKLLGTYIIPLPESLHPETRRIHTSFSQVTAATGRLASTEPNLQNIPIKGEEGRPLRKAFIAREGAELLSLDYSQIELRVLAHYSEDEGLMDAYQNDRDIHDHAAYLLFHSYFDEASNSWDWETQDEAAPTEDGFSPDKYDEARLLKMKETPEYPDLRSQAKVLNFSIVYGVTDWGLSQSLKISKEEGGRLIDSYFRAYPGVKRYMNEVIEQVKDRGYCENLFGRKRLITDLNHSNRFQRAAAERLAMNTPIQSSAADIIKVAMINIQHELDAQNYGSKLLLQIHDELLLEVPTQEKEAVYKMVKDKMENAITLKVPLKVSGGFGQNWDEAK